MSRLKQGAALTSAGAALVAFLINWEGMHPKPYKDSVGVWTYCIGETQNVHSGATPAECRALLIKRLDGYEAGVRRCLKNPDKVPDGAYVASISLAYNIGTAAYCKSSIRRKLDAGDLRGACEAFWLYAYAKGTYLKGLANRRKAEWAICMKGIR